MRSLVLATVALGWTSSVDLFADSIQAAPTGTANAAGEQASPPAVDQEIRAARQAIAVFRKVTAEVGLRPGQSGSRRQPRTAGRTGSWHGRVFEYFRNDALDAVPHEVVQRGGQRNLLRRNQFGFTVNGPVVLPKLLDQRGKSFFTFSYEGTRERVGHSYLTTLPTAQRRLGDFSDLVDRAGRPLAIYDPASTRRNPAHVPSRPVGSGNLEYERLPFPANRIPLTRIDPVARKAASFYPPANTSVGPFLRNNYWANPAERNAPNGFLARVDQNLGGRQKLTLDLGWSNGFQDVPAIYATAGNPGRPDRQFASRGIQLRDTVNLTPNFTFLSAFEADARIVDTLAATDGRDMPAELGLRGVSGTAFPTLRLRGYAGLGASSRSYQRNALVTFELDNQAILRRGPHTWTVESTARFYNWNTLELDAPAGQFSFGDRLSGLPGLTNTGDSFASFLLGQARRAEATDQPHPAYLRNRSFQNSVADQWQVAANLTVTLRVNLDATSPRTERYDRQSSFDPTRANPATRTLGALAFAAWEGERRGFQPFRIRAEPRLGISWSPSADRNTTVRATLLRSYSPISLRSGPFATQGFSRRRLPISPNRQLEPAVTLDNGFPEADRPLPDLRGDFANDTDVDMIPRTAAQPTYDHARLEIERRLPKGLLFRAAGRTTRGRNLLIGGQIVGLNRPPVEALAYRDRLNTEAFRRSLRPFPHVQDVRMNYQYPGGRYRFHEGRLNLQKRAGNGLSLDLEYAYLKRWDDYSGPGIQNPRERSSAWALSRGLRPQRFSLSYTYELPFGPSGTEVRRSGVVARLLADWSVSGFSRLYAGDPLVLEPLFNNTGGIVPALRVDPVSGIDPHVARPGPEAWFNPHAFVDPPDFQLGAVPRTHPMLRNPAYRNHDISVTKRFALSQHQSVEVLVQGFNFLNQGNWNDPDTEIGPAHARNANAGKIIGSRGGRVLQLGLRYNF